MGFAGGAFIARECAERYRTSSKFRPDKDGATFDFNGAAAMPAPTSALPATAEKLAVLTQRASCRQNLWHPQDGRPSERTVIMGWFGRAKAFDGKWYPVQITGDCYSQSDPLRVEWLGGEVSRDVEIEIEARSGHRSAAAKIVRGLKERGWWRARLRRCLRPEVKIA